MAKRNETRAQKLWRLLSERPGRWLTSAQLVAGGAGYRFGSGIHLLRRGRVTGKPEDIETRCVSASEGIWAYRLKPEGKP